jgi:hypothetical protein
MYSKRAGLILGFHGCDKSVRDSVVAVGGNILKPSNNDYDWLGHGVYFWENNCKRAMEFAWFLKNNPPHNAKQKIEEPAVIGAIIDLGHCFDFLDSEYLNVLREGYELLKATKEKYGLEIPQNLPLVKDGDLIKRHLDCAVIETIHQFNEDKGKPSFDSVRGVFFEGEDLYKNAGFKSKNHIQIAIRNPNCIKGYFIPRELDLKHPKP